MMLSPRNLALVIFLGSLSTSVSAATQNVPQDRDRKDQCGGVAAGLLTQRRSEALTYALAHGATQADFVSHEENCPKRDLLFYNAILSKRPAQ
jgi:hypothetical protein